MVQILPAVPSFGADLGRALGGAVQEGVKGYQQGKVNKQLKELTGVDVSSWPPETKQKLLQEYALMKARKKMFEDFEQDPQQQMGQQLQGSSQNMMQESAPQQEPQFIQELKTRFEEAIPQLEQNAGRQFSPEEKANLWKTAVTAQMQQRGQFSGQPKENESVEKLPTQEPKKDYYKKVKQAIASNMPKEYIDVLTKQALAEQKKAELPKEEYIKQEYKSLPKFLDGLEATEEKIPLADLSIKLAEEAIEDPSKWDAFRDFLADKSGYEGFRSSRGAELTSAIKQYFLGDLSSIKGGRPNQLIEQQLLDAYPKIGRDPIANQKIMQGMKMQQEISREKVKVARELEEKYLSEQGFLPPGFQTIVRKQLRPFVDKIEKQTINKLSALSKFQNEYESMAKKQLREGEILMLSPTGEYEAIEKKQMQKAKEAGYIKLKE